MNIVDEDVKNLGGSSPEGIEKVSWSEARDWIVAIAAILGAIAGILGIFL